MRSLTASLLVLGLAAVIVMAGCGGNGFDLQGLQIRATPTTMHAIAGQKCIFLVQVTHGGGGGAVTISVTAPGTVTSVEPASITGDQVCEVTVTPSPATVGTSVPVSIRGERGSESDSEEQTIMVLAGSDGLGPAATQLRNTFVDWLAANRPDLGITDATAWTGTIVRPDSTVVAYYLFFSDQWEMGLSWHVMIPPNDWAVMYLRDRDTETRPSMALEIQSVSGATTPFEVSPPLQPYR
jgi:hypothetical protein